MSIGKNAIKRVENNGYSKVKTAAPVVETPAKKPAAKKSPAKKACTKKCGKKLCETKGVQLCEDMPYYLL